MSISENWLVVTSEAGESKVPIEDLYSVIVDNQRCLISTPTIARLSEASVHIIVCNEKHQPASVILPQSIHYRPLNVVRSQMALTQEQKDRLWDRIVQAKINNQAEVLSLCGGKRERVTRLRELADEVINGDEGNREGIAAKMFFREMYGSEFVRMNDDCINAALNYGYTIIRSAFCKALVSYGYFCVLGIHHISEANPFNLADDMMEPLRPVVDMWVDDHHEDLVDELTRQQRNELAALVNELVMIDGKKMYVRNAIDKYVCSLTTAIKHGSARYLLIPTVIRPDPYRDEDESEEEND